MRILLLNYEFPPLGGGAATAAAQISRYMTRMGAEVAVLTSGFKGLPAREDRDGYTIHRARVWRKQIDRCTVPEMASYMAGSVRPALRLASSFKPDVQHVFFGMPTGPIGLLVNKLHGVPYLLSLRGGDVPGFMGQELARMHALTMPVLRRVWANASIIVANSQGLHDLAQPTAPNRKIEIVPNGVDTERFKPDHAQRQGDKARLFFAGRFANQKGLPYLLQALALLEPELRNNVELELVGSGPEEERLKALSGELGLNGVVRFAGWASRDEIVKHYQQASVFVLPSLDEGMPNAMLEAMAAGNAIIATDIRGNQELVEQDANGLLVPAASAEALTVALRTVLADARLRERMGRHSRVIAERYDWSNTARRYLDFSEAIVAAKKRKGAPRNLETSSQGSPRSGGLMKGS